MLRERDSIHLDDHALPEPENPPPEPVVAPVAVARFEAPRPVGAVVDGVAADAPKPPIGGAVLQEGARRARLRSQPLLRRALGPGGDIEDLVQESFLLFFRQIKDIRDPAALRPFLLGIAARVARYDLRRRRLSAYLNAAPEVPRLGGGARGRGGVLEAISDRRVRRRRRGDRLRAMRGSRLAVALGAALLISGAARARRGGHARRPGASAAAERDRWIYCRAAQGRAGSRGPAVRRQGAKRRLSST
ncbi:sigma factor [Sorangium sp. So ce1014]|uniref:RNA polymerase sigma factor n=1 Tax=Sorangium sp. So ce1014 TaxID=3133326 RepID=UPI003F62ADAB